MCPHGLSFLTTHNTCDANESLSLKKGTVVHEMSHFVITADTDDFSYGQSGCRDLADSNPGNAINNADNHEYMAENTPDLACDTGSPVPPVSFVIMLF